jgi:catechol 2,3-dioxygenase-like lactoylglutathione lyase family enzyme
VDQATAAGIFDKATMAATVLRVRNVEKSVEWYRDKLGLEPIHVGDDGPEHPIASFVIAGAVIALWQLATDEIPVAEDTGSYVVAVMNTDLEQLRQRLIERDVEVGDIRPHRE